MQAKMLVEAEIRHPDLRTHAQVIKLFDDFHTGKIDIKTFNARRRITVPAGQIIDHPQAHLLVKGGLAEPHDAECQRACASVLPVLPDVIDAAVALSNAQALPAELAEQNASDADVEGYRNKRASRKAAAADAAATPATA